MDSKEKYVIKICNATPSQLIVITYELLLEHISGAMDSFDAPTECELHLMKARKFLEELMGSLDMSHEISKQLMSIYLYVNQHLINAGVTEKPERRSGFLKDVSRILESLLPVWKEVSNNPNEQVLFDNIPKVFAGLTYNSRGELIESTEQDEKRGYKV